MKRVLQRALYTGHMRGKRSWSAAWRLRQRGVYWASGFASRSTAAACGRASCPPPPTHALEADRAEQRRRVLPPQPRSSTPSERPAADGDAAAPAPAPAVAVSNDRSAEPADPTTTSGRAEWPDFRGPNRDGHYQGPPIRTDARGCLPLLWNSRPAGLCVVRGRRRTGVHDRTAPAGRRSSLRTTSRTDARCGHTAGKASSSNRWEERSTRDADVRRRTHLCPRGGGRASSARRRHRHPRLAAHILADAGTANLSWGMSGAPLFGDDK